MNDRYSIHVAYTGWVSSANVEDVRGTISFSGPAAGMLRDKAEKVAAYLRSKGDRVTMHPVRSR